MAETWKEVAGYEGLYQISSKGRLMRKGKVLKMCIANGYGHYILSKNGEKKNATPHRLVANAFLPKVDGKDYINHKDANRLNNDVDNLEWCTQRENVIHAIKLGRDSRTSVDKLITEAKIEKVLLLQSLGLTFLAISKNISVDPSTVSRIVNRKRQYADI